MIEQSSQDKAWEEERDLWETRRNIARGVLKPVVEVQKRKIDRAQERKAKGTDEATAERTDDMKTAVVATALFAAVFTAIARFGGRAAVLSVMGLDILQNADVQSRMNEVLTSIDGMGPLKVVIFFGLWLVAKNLCLDALALVLALSSGIVFGGVFEGAFWSIVCATGASLVGFGLARTALREKVSEQIAKRPILRALERAVSKDGLKTVFTLRLSPMIPGLPIGAYNFLYGVTAVSVADFTLGMLAGSIKPYFLDAYLGIMGEGLIRGTEQANEGLLFLTFLVVVLVGTFATQLAGRAWEEAQAEAMREERGADTSGGAAVRGGGGWDWYTMLGMERPKEGLLVEEWGRIEAALQEEWVKLQQEEDEKPAEDKGSSNNSKDNQQERRGVQQQHKQQQQQQPQPHPVRDSRAPTVLTADAPPPPSLSSSSSSTPSPPPPSAVEVVPAYADGSRKVGDLKAQLVGIMLFPVVLLGMATTKLGEKVGADLDRGKS